MGLIGKLTGVLGAVAVVIGLAGCATNGTVAYTGPGGEIITKGQVIDQIEETLDQADELEDEGRQDAARQMLQKKSAQLGANLGDSDAGYILSEAAEQVAGLPNEQAVDFLESRLDMAIEALEFEANVSAELPEGWPEPSMIGLVRVKEYPSMRMVKVRGSEEDEMFGVLFDHINERDIPMTAPVQLDYKVRAQEQMWQDAMAFYYPSEQVGSTGRAGEAVVFDSEPVTVVSVAMRGGYNEDTYMEGVEKLTDWLGQNEEYRAAGGVRVLGYNGPFTPWWMKYSEVQIPVQRVQ